MLKEIQMLEIKSEIQKKVYTDIDQQQRDYFLRQQIKVLQDELGYDGPEKEVEKLRKRGLEKKMADRKWRRILPRSLTRCCGSIPRQPSFQSP